MAETKIKNRYAKTFLDREEGEVRYWGENIWGKKAAIAGAVVLIIMVVLLAILHTQGIIDLRESMQPIEVEHPAMNK